MDRATAVERIREHLSELHQFPVAAVELFGSTARDSSNEASDVDVLVTFRRPPTLREFMALKFALEEWLGARVDLVDRAAVREAWRGIVERDAILVA